MSCLSSNKTTYRLTAVTGQVVWRAVGQIEWAEWKTERGPSGSFSEDLFVRGGEDWRRIFGYYGGRSCVQIAEAKNHAT